MSNEQQVNKDFSTQNSSKTKGNSADPLSESFFYFNDIDTLLLKLNKKQYEGRVERNNLILNLVHLKQPITKYEIAKISGVSYATIKQIVKEFEFCGLVISKADISENGMPCKSIFINKVRGEKLDG